MENNQITEEIDNAPGASRVAESLRDTGYDFNVAIADIIDNSVDAEATEVSVTAEFDLNYDLAISIIDNGLGMDREGLINALRYGADEQNPAERLGKFGLGLKTASTSFCRRIELVSRSTIEGPVLAAVWDLDKVAETNKWTVQLVTPSASDIEDLDEIVSGGPGTIVRWQKIDRLLFNYADKSGSPRKKALVSLIKNLNEHLGIVFQRFLDDSFSDVGKIQINVNGAEVLPIDPFCTDVIEPYAEEIVEVEKGDGTKHTISIRSFVLPREEEFLDEKSAKAARVGNDTQGVYVYRENRLIHGPDWLGIYKMEPHYSLARVELNFDHEMDEAFQVDIKKSRIILDSELYNMLKTDIFNPVRALADQRRRNGKAPEGTVNIHKPASTTIGTKMPTLTVPHVTNVDEKEQEAQVSNNGGDQKVPLRIVTGEKSVVAYIDTANSLRDGVLWEPAIINGSPGVTLNTEHDYYQKAYLPNKENSTVIQSLDYLLWAVAQAELNNIDPENREAFEEFRVEVSRNLRKLVANLPEAKLTLD